VIVGFFGSTGFTIQVILPTVGAVPANVARICAWTWACATPPTGPGQHADQTGYARRRTRRPAWPIPEPECPPPEAPPRLVWLGSQK
jgi:hypothetical protein